MSASTNLKVEQLDINGSLMYATNMPVGVGIQFIKKLNIRFDVSGTYKVLFINSNSESFVKKYLAKN
ncbi:MAG: hypothetical protein DRI74_05010 [Bacteroidetes bacterium]|nr:MAG: hypothetical protein DRI74_05010 [Bacteroidota bacterium]